MGGDDHPDDHGGQQQQADVEQQGDVRALARQFDRGGAADPARGAGDKRRLAGERLGAARLRRDLARVCSVPGGEEQ